MSKNKNSTKIKWTDGNADLLKNFNWNDIDNWSPVQYSILDPSKNQFVIMYRHINGIRPDVSNFSSLFQNLFSKKNISTPEISEVELDLCVSERCLQLLAERHYVYNNNKLIHKYVSHLVFPISIEAKKAKAEVVECDTLRILLSKQNDSDILLVRDVKDFAEIKKDEIEREKNTTQSTTDDASGDAVCSTSTDAKIIIKNKSLNDETNNCGNNFGDEKNSKNDKILPRKLETANNTAGAKIDTKVSPSTTSTDAKIIEDQSSSTDEKNKSDHEESNSKNDKLLLQKLKTTNAAYPSSSSTKSPLNTSDMMQENHTESTTVTESTIKDNGTSSEDDS